MCHLVQASVCWKWHMRVGWHGNAFSITGPLWGESNFAWWIPSQSVRWSIDASVVSLNKLLTEQSSCRWFETPWCPLGAIVMRILGVITDNMLSFVVVSRGCLTRDASWPHKPAGHSSVSLTTASLTPIRAPKLSPISHWFDRNKLLQKSQWRPFRLIVLIKKK